MGNRRRRQKALMVIERGYKKPRKQRKDGEEVGGGERFGRET